MSKCEIERRHPNQSHTPAMLVKEADSADISCELFHLRHTLMGEGIYRSVKTLVEINVI